MSKPIASWDALCAFLGLNERQRAALVTTWRLGGMGTDARHEHTPQTMTSLVRKGLARRSDRMPWPTYVITWKAHALIQALQYAEGCLVDWDGKGRSPLGQERVVSCYHCKGKGRTCLGLPVEDDPA